MGPPQPGDTAPDFDLPKLDGTRVRLSSLRGDWVLLHFTASWCPYCDAEIEHLGKLADAYAGRGVKTVLVDVKEDATTWEPYARTHVAPRVIALADASGEASARFAPPRAQPSFKDRAQVLLDCTLIIDPQGVIRLFLIPDSAHFDPTFSAVRRELDRMIGVAPQASASREGTTAAADAIVAPEDVVQLSAAMERDDAVVTMHIRPGYHVMSNHPSRTNYVATRVDFEQGETVHFGEATYPAPEMIRGVDGPLSTFAGTVSVHVPVRSTSPSTVTVKGKVRYQACTETRCLFPTTLPISFDLRRHE